MTGYALTSVVPARAAAIYRALVYLYPPAFRRAFACEMAADFEDATSEAWCDGRWRAVVPLWMYFGRDFAATISVQWFRHGLPLAAGLAVAGVAASGVAIARSLWHPIDSLRLRPTDQDALTLLFLGTMVFLLAVVVIVFTVFFLPRVLRRDARVRRV